MLTDGEKIIVEKFINFHKKSGGNVSHDMRTTFTKSLKREGFFDMNPIVNKSIALGLIKYLFTDQTGWTELTKQGWDFSNFNEFDQSNLNQQEIDQITIKKLKVDLGNSKRQSIMFWPLTILTILLGFSTLYYSTRKPNTNSIKNLETITRRLDSVVKDLNVKFEQIHADTSRLVSTSLTHDR